MGAWGLEPWENDSAADWFGDLMDETGLAKRVETALNGDVEDSHEEIRAAAYLVHLLARTYIWPVEDIDRHRALAASKLREIVKSGVIDEPEYVQKMEKEAAELSAGSK